MFIPSLVPYKFSNLCGPVGIKNSVRKSTKAETKFLFKYKTK